MRSNEVGLNKIRPVAALPKGTLRGVEPSADIGKPPQLDWVEPKSLCVEEDYQRDLSQRSIGMIRRIVAGWRWSKIKPVICVRVGNRLAVIDGQHTAIAAASHGGIDKIPVMIVEAASVKERAEAFISQNRDRLALTPMHMHFAALAAGDEIAVAVDQACRKAGVTILRTGKGERGVYRVGETLAIGIIGRIVSRIGVHNGAKILKVLVDAKRAPIAAHEIAAVQQLLFDAAYKGKVDPFDLATMLRSKPMEEWRAIAWALVPTGLSRRQALAAALFNALHKRGGNARA